jgi:hypothetical protein
MSRRPKRLTTEVVARIKHIRSVDPDLSFSQIGARFSPPISSDAVGKVIRGQVGPSVGPDGKLLNHKNGWKTGVLRARLEQTGSIRREATV